MNSDDFTGRFTASFLDMLRAYEYCMQHILSKYGLYPGQPQLLFAISEMQKPTQNQLALRLSVSKASVGMSLRRLEKAGFVRRIRDREDTRCIRIILTKQGEEYARWCRIDFEMLFSTMLENIDYDRRESTLSLVERINMSLNNLKSRIHA